MKTLHETIKELHLCFIRNILICLVGHQEFFTHSHRINSMLSFGALKMKLHHSVVGAFIKAHISVVLCLTSSG